MFSHITKGPLSLFEPNSECEVTLWHQNVIAKY